MLFTDHFPATISQLKVNILGIRCLLLFCFVSVINVGQKMHGFLALINFDFDFDCLLAL